MGRSHSRSFERALSQTPSALLPGSTIELPVCERYSSYNIGEMYAEVGSSNYLKKKAAAKFLMLLDSISEQRFVRHRLWHRLGQDAPQQG